MLLKKNHGLKRMSDSMTNAFMDKCRKMGQLCSSDMKFNKTTINHYMACIARSDGVSISQSRIAKTNNCLTAEHLNIGTMALIIVVSFTHYYVTAEEELEWKQLV
jgi:hypothetical protein